MNDFVHEIGHVLNADENDETNAEVYSGTANDNTHEAVVDSSQSTDTVVWSVMSSGTTRAQYLPPTDEHYVAYSIEELLTVSTADTQVKDNDR